jgi:3-oxoacyl-[acyl-carrier protein] reductase
LRLDDLPGRRVLITGAATGIGAAAARAFAQQGARVAIHHNRSGAAAAALAEELQGAPRVHGDLTRRGEARRVVESAVRALGGLDILINNAGAIIRRAAFTEIDDELIEQIYALNARSVVEASQAAIPYLSQDRGVIVNIGSSAGQDGGAPGSAIYAASKSFVHNLTRHLARDLAGRGIRVNAIAPGATNTPFHAATPAERLRDFAAFVPLGRIGEPEDCVGPLLFLASNALSGFVTGQVLSVNGGALMT